MDPIYCDIYAFFGVTKAEVEENERKLDKAYRTMCLTCHPDKGGDQETFEKVHNYYKILSSVVDRRNYDEWYATDSGRKSRNNFNIKFIN